MRVHQILVMVVIVIMFFVTLWKDQDQIMSMREEMRELSLITSDTKRAIAPFTPVHTSPLEPVLKSWLSETSATLHRADMVGPQITVSGYINDEDVYAARRFGASLTDDQRPDWKLYTLVIKNSIEP